jgi:hypothetical protein
LPKGSFKNINKIKQPWKFFKKEKRKPHNTSSNQKQLKFETFHEVPSKLDLEFTIITIGKKSSKCAKCKPITIQI